MPNPRGCSVRSIGSSARIVGQSAALESNAWRLAAADAPGPPMKLPPPMIPVPVDVTVVTPGDVKTRELTTMMVTSRAPDKSACVALGSSY